MSRCYSCSYFQTTIYSTKTIFVVCQSTTVRRRWMETERHQGKVFKSSQNNFCTAGLDHKQLAGLRRDRLCHNRSGTQTQGGASFNFYTLVTSFEIRGSAASSCRSHQPGSVWEQRRRNLGSGAPPLPTSSLRWDQTLPEAELCCSQNVDYPPFLIFSGR